MRLCSICARGGSKRLPGKNLKDFAGKPLIAHSIEQAIESELFDYIAVSSDSDDILSVAKKSGADLLIKRPSKLSDDFAGKHSAMLHALKEVEEVTGKRFSTYVDLDATAPLRLKDDIIFCVKLLEDSGCSSVMTATPSRRSPYFNIVEMSGGKVSLSKEGGNYLRSQDTPKSYDMNGAIYAWQRDVFIKDQKNFYDNTKLAIMPEARGCDIDSPIDFDIAEMLFTNGTYKQGKIFAADSVIEESNISVKSKKKEFSENLFSLTGKVIFITGGAGILGEKIARLGAAQGAKIIIGDKDYKKAKLLAKDLQNHGYESEACDLDVSNEDSVKHALNFTLEKFGRVDSLFNNAASKSKDLKKIFADTKDFDMKIWREIMSVNLDGAFLMMRNFGEHMAKHGGGSIIQTGSIYGMISPDMRIYEGSQYLGHKINSPAVYTASKAGLAGLTNYFATLWGSKNLRVNTIIPGGIDSGQNAEFNKKYSARVPMNRMAQSEEVAATALFLATDAASYVTGQHIFIDGGLSAW